MRRGPFRETVRRPAICPIASRSIHTVFRVGKISRPISRSPSLPQPGQVWNHHGEDGRFRGLIDPDLIKPEIARAIPCMGTTGSISSHHVRALHGSALNTSNRPRNLLPFEVAASDTWPRMDVKDYEAFNRRALAGPPVNTPSLTNVPVRMPLPPASRQGTIYETQLSAAKSYFEKAG